VYLYPEDEHSPHFVGRIVSAFVDETAPESDPHRIEVRRLQHCVPTIPALSPMISEIRVIMGIIARVGQDPQHLGGAARSPCPPPIKLAGEVV